MKGKKCLSQKLGLLSLFVALCFGVSLLLSHNASAVSLPIASLQMRYKETAASAYQWSSGLSYNQYVNLNNYLYNANSYQWNSSAVNVTGNYAAIHFETNIVMSQPSDVPWWGDFVNLGYIRVIGCSASGSGSLGILSQSVRHYVTEWTGPAPTIPYHNKTLTLNVDLSLSGLSTGSQNIYCMIGSSEYAFYQTTYANSSPLLWFEQQPTTIEFTNNPTDSLLNTQIEQNQTIINQNETIIENVEDLTDTITDDTVEGDFTMPDIPAFGPIAEIINGIIGLPQGIINSINRPCVPLTGPMPLFPDKTITLPCFKTIATGFTGSNQGGFWPVVNTIEYFIAMYMWYRTALFIVRSVKKLRDPQNEDEEYLDL